MRINLLSSIISFIEEHMRQSDHKFKKKPPRCMSHFNSLKIFVDMIKNKYILSPPSGEIFDQMMAEIEKKQDLEG